MNFPSTEFDDAVSATCQGTGSEADLAALHAALQTDEAARDEYLWQVELHSYLAALAPRRTTRPMPVLNENPRLPASRRRALVPWAIAAAAVVLAFLGGLSWHGWTAPGPDGTGAENDTSPVSPGGLAGEGFIRQTHSFAGAADVPILIGIGRQESIDLGAEVPYDSGGDTLHVWDWSRSKQSRVMKDVRLWPVQTFCISPDGTQVVWARGDVLNLTSGVRSTLDLGGEFHVGHEGGTLQRIAQMQFTPDGRRLALLLSNLVLTKSAHPLRRYDLTTERTFQVVEFPSGKLVCEFPAGTPADLPLAFSADGKRAVSQYAHGKSSSKIVERSTQTGKVRREYEPALREYASAIGLSADGSLLAVYDSAGDALLWDTRTGKLKHKVSLPGSNSAHLRFSPDGKLLALSLFSGLSPKLILIDVAEGTIVAKVAQESSGDIHWSADSKSFDVLYLHRGIREDRDRAGRPVMYNLYPTVRTFQVADLRKQ